MPSNRNFRALVSLIVVAGLAAAWAPAFGLTTGGGAEKRDFDNLPAGANALANHDARVSYINSTPYGDHFYAFEYLGDTAAFNESLELFSQIRAPKLELIVSDGPSHAYATNRDENVFANWRFMVWNFNDYHKVHNDPRFLYNATEANFRQTSPPIVMEVFIESGGPIVWEDVQVPDNVLISDQRASVFGIGLEHGDTVIGEVYDMATGQPIEGARVTLTSYPYDEAPPANLSAITGSGGTFRISNIPEDGHYIDVSALGFAARRAGWFNGQSTNFHHLTTYLSATASIRGRVVDSGGMPVPGASLLASRTLGIDGLNYALPQRCKPAVTGPDGRFRIEGLPGGFVQLYAPGEEWGSREFPAIVKAPSNDLEMVFYRMGVIRGHVENAPPDTSVFLDVRNHQHWNRTAHVSEDGAYEFKNIAPGNYTLGISGSTFTHYQRYRRGERDDPPPNADRDLHIIRLKPGQTLEFDLTFHPE